MSQEIITPADLLKNVTHEELLMAIASYQSAPGEKYYEHEIKRARKLVKALRHLPNNDTLRNYLLVGRAAPSPDENTHCVKVQLLRKKAQQVDVGHMVESTKGYPQMYLQECVDNLHVEEYIHEHRHEAIMSCQCDRASVLRIGAIPFLANIIAQMLNPDCKDLW